MPGPRAGLPGQVQAGWVQAVPGSLPPLGCSLGAAMVGAGTGRGMVPGAWGVNAAKVCALGVCGTTIARALTCLCGGEKAFRVLWG